MPMAGLSMASLKKHPALVPLYVCVGAGVAWAAYYVFRLSTRCPDVGWKNKSGDMPNTKWSINDQYKFYSPIKEYKSLKFPDERPQI